MSTRWLTPPPLPRTVRRRTQCGAPLPHAGPHPPTPLVPPPPQAADRLLLITDAAPLASRAPAAAAGAFGEIGGAGGGGAADAAAGGAANDLSVLHVPLPAHYCAANWPAVHAAASAHGGDVAVSGRRGLAVYSRHAERWRLFGDVTQVRRIAARARAD